MFRSLLLASAVLAASSAFASDFPFSGTWTIVDVAKAPWEDPERPLETDDAERYKGKTVTIGEGSIEGPELLGCGKTEMSVKDVPYAGLFEGMLAVDPRDASKAPNEAQAKLYAEAMGFAAEPVPSLSQGCSEIVLHLRDPQIMMFGMNNRIFMLMRQ